MILCNSFLPPNMGVQSVILCLTQCNYIEEFFWGDFKIYLLWVWTYISWDETLRNNQPLRLVYNNLLGDKRDTLMESTRILYMLRTSWEEMREYNIGNSTNNWSKTLRGSSSYYLKKKLRKLIFTIRENGRVIDHRKCLGNSEFFHNGISLR